MAINLKNITEKNYIELLKKINAGFSLIIELGIQFVIIITIICFGVFLWSIKNSTVFSKPNFISILIYIALLNFTFSLKKKFNMQEKDSNFFKEFIYIILVIIAYKFFN